MSLERVDDAAGAEQSIRVRRRTADSSVPRLPRRTSERRVAAALVENEDLREQCRGVALDLVRSQTRLELVERPRGAESRLECLDCGSARLVDLPSDLGQRTDGTGRRFAGAKIVSVFERPARSALIAKPRLGNTYPVVDKRRHLRKRTSGSAPQARWYCAFSSGVKNARAACSESQTYVFVTSRSRRSNEHLARQAVHTRKHGRRLFVCGRGSFAGEFVGGPRTMTPIMLYLRV